MKQTKLTRSARGQECQIRIPGVCNGDPETTVLAHLNGGGMGTKRSDIHGAYACSACHDAVDGRSSVDAPAWHLHIYHCEGIIRTQEIMINAGLIEVKG